MQSINALSVTSHVRDWLANSRQPRMLHIFDSACNLINERREVLSIVTPQIGNGPFNLVVEGMVCFAEYLHLQSSVSISERQFVLGDLTIQVTGAKPWNPRPDWEMLHANRTHILNQVMKLQTMDDFKYSGLDTSFAVAQLYSTIAVPKLPVTNYQPFNSLSSSLAIADLPSSLAAAKQLAGLGAGLTPAGDDFIMGALYAAWIIHPREVASVLAQDIANSAAPLTTSLSAAWLRSAGRGEAGVLWHQFFEASVGRVVNPTYLREAMDKILSIGETSGADALAGFFNTLSYSIPHSTL